MQWKLNFTHDDNAHKYCVVCVCLTYSAYSVQPGHPDACWMTVHFRVCIYLPLVTGGNVWEVRSAKPNSTADTRWTTYTHFPSHLGRDLHTPHTDHCPSSVWLPPSSLPLHRSAPGSLSFPTLYHQFHCSTLWGLWEYGKENNADYTADSTSHHISLCVWVYVCVQRWLSLRRMQMCGPWPHCFLCHHYWTELCNAKLLLLPWVCRRTLNKQRHHTTHTQTEPKACGFT